MVHPRSRACEGSAGPIQTRMVGLWMQADRREKVALRIEGRG